MHEKYQNHSKFINFFLKKSTAVCLKIKMLKTSFVYNPCKYLNTKDSLLTRLFFFLIYKNKFL